VVCAEPREANAASDIVAIAPAVTLLKRDLALLGSFTE